MPKQIILTGRVQGVFCRQYCSQNAKKLALHGSASNLYDGSVSVILETEDDALLDKYINALKTNPYKFTFFGKIEGIKTIDCTDALKGDYNF